LEKANKLTVIRFRPNGDVRHIVAEVEALARGESS
jgi:hypothetical protein